MGRVGNLPKEGKETEGGIPRRNGKEEVPEGTGRDYPKGKVSGHPSGKEGGNPYLDAHSNVN